MSALSNSDAKGASEPMSEALARAMVFAIVLTVTLVIETFVLQRLSGSAVTAVTEDIRAYYRPDRGPDRTAVLLYDDSFDKELGQAWPLPYSTWIRVTMRAWCLGARALVFDLGFSRGAHDPGQPASMSEGNFLRLLRTLSADDAVTEAAAVRGALYSERCGDGEDGEHVLSRAPRPAMPVYLAPPSDPELPPDMRAFEVDVDENANGIYARHGANGHLTAAFAAATAYCAQGANDAPGCTGQINTIARFEPEDTWTTPDEQRQFSAPAEDSASPHCTGRRYTHWWPMLESFALTGPLRTWATCPPVLTLQAAQLWGSDIGSTLAGKIVFIGARIGGMQDAVQTPLHRDMPGVFIHALATEELLDNHAAPPPPSDYVQFGALGMVFLAATLTQGFILPRVVAGVLGSAQPEHAIHLSDWITASLAFIVTWIVGWALVWPPLTIARDSLLVLIALGFRSLDPAEFLVNLTGRMRETARGDFQASQKSKAAAENGVEGQIDAESTATPKAP